MARKPGRMYRSIKQQPFTRKEYTGGIPVSRITQFDMGDKKAKFPIHLSLISNERCQIRHNALEAARITANRALEKYVGAANYRLRVHIFPHHVLRENKQATGAGADRVSQGMRASFGKNVGTAARVERGQEIMSVGTTERNIELAKNALRKAGMKIPPPCIVIFNRNT